MSDGIVMEATAPIVEPMLVQVALAPEAREEAKGVDGVSLAIGVIVAHTRAPPSDLLASPEAKVSGRVVGFVSEVEAPVGHVRPRGHAAVELGDASAVGVRAPAPPSR
eukprot:CAMPEP_0198506664 /NCGR_PEP_ID=MMETSP1462-20131121/11838_1 /TAXON_ID=1333877 /ORGANISM="Brandtodinium nutriculum, Strain RCC3387" /LENGTH=107 /DNA_ID=CAMNT_0044235889 /DNA_START=35 /DNA_END=358 /DNA_ORIENTATION=-